MYFGRITIILLIVSLAVINAAPKRRPKKIRKSNPPLISGCGCNPTIDIQCGCQKIIETFSPLDIVGPLPIKDIPIIDIPNYRYADPIELSPLGCLFPGIEIPNIGLLSSVSNLPNVEYIIDNNCGCPGPVRSCRAPAVKLPTFPNGCLPPCNCQNLPYTTDVPICISSFSAIDIPYSSPVNILELPCGQRPIIPFYPDSPSCACQGITIPAYSNIEIPSCGCQNLPIPMYPGIEIPPCGCQGVNIPIYQEIPCGCQRQASPMYPNVDFTSGCQFQTLPVYADVPCGCGSQNMNIPVVYSPSNKNCGCQGSCGCNECNIQIPQCGCSGPCGCQLQIEVPAYGCGCGCGSPGCNCGSPAYVYGSPDCGCGSAIYALPGCGSNCGCGSSGCVYGSPSCGCGSPDCGCGSPAYVYASPGCGCGSSCVCGSNCGCGSPNYVYGSSGCGCGSPCGCDNTYLRQVTLQPPFL